MTCLVILVAGDYHCDKLGAEPSLWRQSARVGVKVLEVGSGDHLMGGEEVSASVPQVPHCAVVGIQRHQVGEDPANTSQPQSLGNLGRISKSRSGITSTVATFPTIINRDSSEARSAKETSHEKKDILL